MTAVSLRPPIVTSTRWLPANVFYATSGSPTLSAFGGGTSLLSAWLLDAAAVEQVTATHQIPTEWTTYAVDLWWTNQAAGAGDVRWSGRLDQVVDTGDMTTLDRVITAIDVTAPVATIMKVTALDTAVPDTGGLLSVSVQRVATHANDTLANDCAMVGVNLRRLT